MDNKPRLSSKKRRGRSKSKSRPTQTQSQKVIVNLGGVVKKTKSKKKTSSGGVRAPNSQNLIPFHIQTASAQQPLVDYDRIARLTGALQERNEPNRTPSLQSQQIPSQMAFAAAEQRRAGPTASGFQEPASIASRRENDAPFSQPIRQMAERFSMASEDANVPPSATRTRVAPHRGTQPYVSSLPNRPVVGRGNYTQQQMLEHVADDFYPDMSPTQAQEVVGQELLDAQKEAQKRDFI